MEKIYKEIGQAYTDYAVSTGRKIVEFNTKLVRDYLEFNQNLVRMVPGMERWVPVPTKK